MIGKSTILPAGVAVSGERRKYVLILRSHGVLKQTMIIIDVILVIQVI